MGNCMHEGTLVFWELATLKERGAKLRAQLTESGLPLEKNASLHCLLEGGRAREGWFEHSCWSSQGNGGTGAELEVAVEYIDLNLVAM